MISDSNDVELTEDEVLVLLIKAEISDMSILDVMYHNIPKEEQKEKLEHVKRLRTMVNL